MVNQHESENRLAELIWRTIKLRIWLLILCILALLVVWSALINGNEEARKIDDKFCVFLVNQDNEMQKLLTLDINGSGHGRVQPVLKTPEDYCGKWSTESRVYIESTRYNDETIWVPYSQPTPPDYVTRILSDNRRAFPSYDNQRRGAYRLQLHLSSEYSSGSVEVNALSVAETLPFCVFIILTIYFILGFQDNAYRILLRSSLEKLSDEDKGLSLAQAQFFGSSRYRILSPDRLATATLLIAVLVLLVKVISLFILNLVHLTDTIFSGYPFKLYLSLTILGAMLLFARRGYLPLQSRRKNVFALTVIRLLRHLNKCQLWLKRRLPRLVRLASRFSEWPPVIVAILCFVSLLLPWADSGGDEIAGINFALKQAAHENMKSFMSYAINPRVFNEMRFQLYVALLLAIVCALYVLIPRTGTVTKALKRARICLAWGTTFFAVNFLIYLAILQYESMTPTPWPMDIQFHEGGAFAKGESMSLYNPDYGFWIFLGCCAVLALISLKPFHHREDSR
jgi:hypothetical protein